MIKVTREIYEDGKNFFGIFFLEKYALGRYDENEDPDEGGSYYMLPIALKYVEKSQALRAEFWGLWTSLRS